MPNSPKKSPPPGAAAPRGGKVSKSRRKSRKKAATPATVGQLCDLIDWSKADQGQPPASLPGQDGEIQPTEDFKRRFRLVLLDEALFGQGERRAAARTLLHSAGVWGQVVSLLTLKGRTGRSNGPDGPIYGPIYGPDGPFPGILARRRARIPGRFSSSRSCPQHDSLRDLARLPLTNLRDLAYVNGSRAILAHYYVPARARKGSLSPPGRGFLPPYLCPEPVGSLTGP